MAGNDTYIGSPDNPGTAAFVCYITFIGWLLSYFGLYRNQKTELSSFHLRQSLLLHIFSLLLKILFSFLAATLGTAIIVGGLGVLLFIFWLLGFIDALNGREKPLPFIGNLAQRLFQWI